MLRGPSIDNRTWLGLFSGLAPTWRRGESLSVAFRAWLAQPVTVYRADEAVVGVLGLDLAASWRTGRPYVSQYEWRVARGLCSYRGTLVAEKSTPSR